MNDGPIGVIRDISSSKTKLIAAVLGAVLIATLSGVLLYRFYAQNETCSGAIIPTGKGLLDEISYIDAAGRWEPAADREEWPLFFAVTTNRGGWGVQESAWIAAVVWIDGISECGDPSYWQEEGIYPLTPPPAELVAYQYEGESPPSQEIVDVMNDYFREISDEVDWREHARYQTDR